MGRAAVPSGASTDARGIDCATATNSATSARACCARSSTSTRDFRGHHGPRCDDRASSTRSDRSGRTETSRAWAPMRCCRVHGRGKARPTNAACRCTAISAAPGPCRCRADMNINGGACNNSLDMQEFMITRWARRAFATRCAAARGVPRAEGLAAATRMRPRSRRGVSRPPAQPRSALQLCMEAIDKAGYQAGQDVLLALDSPVPSSTRTGATCSNRRSCNSPPPVPDYLATLADKYPSKKYLDHNERNRMSRRS